MNEPHEHLQTLTEIRGLMERSTKFLSLSGLSGVSAGLAALAGAFVAYTRFRWIPLMEAVRLGESPYGLVQPDSRWVLVGIATAVLLAALASGYYFTVRRARRQGLSIRSASSERLLRVMLVPLATGGIFCLGLVYYNLIWLAFPATLIFYGLALTSGSRYTLGDVESLGYCEIALGLLTLFWPSFSLLAWALGFGVLHILYGLAMYVKYERNTA
ncbi:hypothetical protein GCM10027578_01850 [Spirosoma luteolum]